MKRSFPMAAAACVLALATLALAGAPTQFPVKDFENGWSFKPLQGWDTRPPTLPGNAEEARVAAGWFPKGAKEFDESFAVILVFGTYFDDAAKVPEGKAPPPAPERFPAWMKSWTGILDARANTTLSGKGQECRLGPDRGWRYEGRYEVREEKRFGRETYVDTDTYEIVAAAARRGDLEVAVLYFCRSWHAVRPDEKGWLRDSVNSLRILDRADMERKRAELEAKSKGARTEDDAWYLRVRSRIPKGWLSFRRGDTAYVYPEGVASRAVETLATRLDAMRRKAYAKLFPAEISPDTPPAVVKIARDKRQYLAYGAPENSLGYFSAKERELVLYHGSDDWWDRVDPTGTLFHEGFHQYVHQALDGFSAHPWFEEGVGEYFGGWRPYEGEPRRGDNAERAEAMKDVHRAEAWLHLQTLFRMEWDPFYGRGKNAADPAVTYAQSYSLVAYMLSGKRAAHVNRYWAALRDGVAKWKVAEAAAAAAEGRVARSPGEMEAAEAEKLRAAILVEGFRGIDYAELWNEWQAWLIKNW